MKKEFKTINGKNHTRYVLETTTAGATGSSSIATVNKPIGELQKRETVSVPVTQKPRQGHLKTQTGGGAHRDKKKEQKQGKEKHKKPFMESSDWGEPKELLADVMLTLERQVEWPLTDVMDPAEVGRLLQPIRNAVNFKLKQLEQGMAEDHEIQMASSELQAIAKSAVKLLDLVRKYSEQEGLEAWQQSKITKAADYLNSVLQSISGEQGALEGLRDPKDNPCWKGYKPVGTKQKGGRTVPNCVPKERVDVEESGLQYYTGVKKHGKEYMVKAAQAARQGASQAELGALKDKYSKAYKEDNFSNDNPQHSHQYKTTMKHADRPTVQQRMAAHDIKPGIAGYRDRIDLLKDLERTGKLKDDYMENLTQSLYGILGEKAPPGDKYERMVKHIKKGYAKDGKLSAKEKSIAYATAWKAKNKSKK